MFLPYQLPPLGNESKEYWIGGTSTYKELTELYRLWLNEEAPIQKRLFLLGFVLPKQVNLLLNISYMLDFGIKTKKSKWELANYVQSRILGEAKESRIVQLFKSCIDEDYESVDIKVRVLGPKLRELIGKTMQERLTMLMSMYEKNTICRTTIREML